MDEWFFGFSNWMNSGRFKYHNRIVFCSMESIKICRNCEEPNPSENAICEKCNEDLPDEVYLLYPKSNERKVGWNIDYLSKDEKAKRFSSA